MKRIILSFHVVLLLLASAGNAVWAQHSLTIKLSSVPASHTADPVFVAGNFNEWNPGNDRYRLKEKNGGREIVIRDLKPGVYEFKFTRGAWDKVASTMSGSDMNNHLVKLSSDTTIVYDVAAWKDDFARVEKKHTASPNVSVMDTAFYMPQLNRNRRIWIYLPASYAGSKKYYPVLYMHDGQNIFDEYTSGYGEWGIDECLDSLTKNGNNDCIVVGIDNGPQRMNEYNPYNNERFGPGEGKVYATFLAETLKPFIDRKYRTLKDKNNTIVAGSSMGGLISYYTQLTYPAIFGKAGIFSPAFWTAPEIIPATDSLMKTANGKFFFYMGALEGEDYMNDMYNVMQQLGTKSSSLIYSVTDPEGRHNEASWQKWFPEFFRFIMADWTNYVIKTAED